MTGWTPELVKEHVEALLVEVKEHMEARLAERDKTIERLIAELERSQREGDDRLRENIAGTVTQITAAFAHEQRETDKFEATVDKRFIQVNEFRGALDDLGKQMATRRELESAVSSLTGANEVARIERQHQIDDIRSTLSELRSRIDVGAPQIPEMQQYMAETTGRQKGVKMSTGVFFSALAALATVISIVIVIANVATNGG